MDISVMLAIFTSVFTAELGDKTQLATVCFIAGGDCRKAEVFWASSLALILSTVLAVIFGAAIARLIPPRYMHIGAGLIFLIMGGIFVRQAIKNTEGSSDSCALK